ncbi:hypothetical protein GCM10022200_01900 [Microbacterium awajiense]|uniref:Secreted protein n=1 Tax=Microbacterium awajiense TaxID=415214 RepID=A0ABP7A1X3_9MICO
MHTGRSRTSAGVWWCCGLDIWGSSVVGRACVAVRLEATLGGRADRGIPCVTERNIATVRRLARGTTGDQNEGSVRQSIG